MAKKPVKKKAVKKKAVKKTTKVTKKRKPAKKVTKKKTKIKELSVPKQKGRKFKKVSGSQIVMGLISYLWILFIIPLLAKRKDEFVHFHAKQGLVLFLSSIAVMIFTVIPFIGWVIGPILMLVLVVFWIIALINVLMKRTWKMPLLGEWSQRLDL